MGIFGQQVRGFSFLHSLFLVFALLAVPKAEAEREASPAMGISGAVAPLFSVSPLPPSSPSPRAGEDFHETKERLRTLIAESTGLPIDFFDIELDPYKQPSTLAAILTETAKKDRSDVPIPYAKPVFYLSSVLLDEIVTSNDQLRWILRHEFYHNVSSGKLQAYFDSRKEKGEYFKHHTGDTRRDRRVVEFLGSKGLEFYSDLMAQKDGLARGEDPEAPLEAMKQLAAWVKKGDRDEHQRRQTVEAYLHASHPDDPERIDALRGHREYLKGDRESFPFANRDVRSGTHEVEALKKSLRTEAYYKDGLALVDREIRNLEYEVFERAESAKMEALYSAASPEMKHRRLFGEPLGEEGNLRFDQKSAEIRKEVLHRVLKRMESYSRDDHTVQISILRQLDSPVFERSSEQDPAVASRLERLKRRFTNRLSRTALAHLRSSESSEKKSQFFQDVLDGLPKELARQWLLRIPRGIEKNPEGSLYSVLNFLNSSTGKYASDTKPILRFFTADDWLDTMERILKVRPDAFVRHLEETNFGRNYFKQKGEFTAAHHARFSEILLAAATQTDAFTPEAVRWLEMAKSMDLPLAPFKPMIERSLAHRYPKDRLWQRHVDPNEIIHLYQDYPEYRTFALEAAQRLVDVAGQAATDFDSMLPRLHQEWRASDRAKELEESHRNTLRLSHKPFSQAELEAYLQEREDSALEYYRDQLSTAVVALANSRALAPQLKGLDTAYDPIRKRYQTVANELLALDKETFQARINDNLEALRDYFYDADESPHKTLNKKLRASAEARSIRNRGNDKRDAEYEQAHILSLALLDRNFNPELRKRLISERDHFLLRSLGGYREGERAKIDYALSRLLPESEREAFFIKTVESKGLEWRYKDFIKQYPFAVTVKMVAELPIEASKKVELIQTYTKPTSAQEIETILTKVYPDFQKEWLARPLYREDGKDKTPDYGRNFMAFREGTLAIGSLIGARSGNGPQVLLEQSFDSAVREWLTRLNRTVPAFERARTIENILFEKPSDSHSRTDIPQLGRVRLEKELLDLVKPHQIRDRARIIHTARDRQMPSLSSPALIQELYDNILVSPLKTPLKLEAIQTINRILSPAQLLTLWQDLSAPLLKGNYDPKMAAELLNGIYGSYEDGRLRKMNELFNHFEMSEVQMAELRGLVFKDDDIGKSYKVAEVIRGGIKANLSDPKASLDFITWLQGEGSTAPHMGKEVIHSIQSFIGNEMYKLREGTKRAELSNAEKQLLAFYEKSKDQFTETRLKDIYQNNRIEVRMLILSDLLSPSRKEGMLASKEGRELFLDFVTSGMEKNNLKLAKSLLRAQFEALGEEGHALGLQMLASMAGRSENGEISDAEKLKSLLEKKGALWIKIGQQLYGDPYLLPDPKVRETFKSLTDNAAPPDREELYRMLKKALGTEYGKVKRVRRILGSGSINVTVLLEFEDGSQSVARMVKGNPENYTEFEMASLRKMMALLEEEANETEDKAHSATLKKIIYGMEEYLEGTAAKIHAEVDLTREAKLADMVRDSYTKEFSDLGLRVRLVEPEQKVVRFVSGDENKGTADPERIIFYPEIKDISHTLTRAEQRRIQTAIVRTEWEALFRTGKFDPDGHRGNWLVTRDPNNKSSLILHRIDYSQAEQIPTERLSALKSVVEHLFNESYPLLRTKNSLTEKDFTSHYRKLVETEATPEAFERALAAARKTLKASGERNPVAGLALLQANLKAELNGKVKLHPSVRTALKSVMATYGALDQSSPTEAGRLTEEFLRIVIGKSAWVSRLAGTATGALGFAKRFLPKAKEPSIEKERTDFFEAALKETRAKGLPEESLLYLTDNYDRRPKHRRAIFERIEKECTAHGCSAEMLGFLRRHAKHHGYSNEDTWLKKALKDGPAREAAHAILFEEKKALYPAVLESFLKGQLEDLPFDAMTGEFRSFADSAMAQPNAALKPTVAHLLKLPKSQFPKTLSEAPRLLRGPISHEHLALALRHGEELGATGQDTSKHIDLALQAAEALMKEADASRDSDKDFKLRNEAGGLLYRVQEAEDYSRGTPSAHHKHLSFAQFQKATELQMKLQDLHSKRAGEDPTYRFNFEKVRFSNAELLSLLERFPTQLARSVQESLLNRAEKATTGKERAAALAAHDEAMKFNKDDHKAELGERALELAQLDPRTQKSYSSKERLFLPMQGDRLLELGGDYHSKLTVWRRSDGHWLEEKSINYSESGLSPLLGWERNQVPKERFVEMFELAQSRLKLIDAALHPKKYGLPSNFLPDLNSKLLGEWTLEEAIRYRKAIPLVGSTRSEKERKDAKSSWEKQLTSVIDSYNYQAEAADELFRALNLIASEYTGEQRRRLVQRHRVPEGAAAVIAFLKNHPSIDPRGEAELSAIRLTKADLLHLMNIGVLKNPDQKAFEGYKAGDIGLIRSLRFDSPSTEEFFRQFIRINADRSTWIEYGHPDTPYKAHELPKIQQWIDSPAQESSEAAQSATQDSAVSGKNRRCGLMLNRLLKR